MKSVKIVFVSSVVMLFIMFAVACGGQDINLDLLRANVQLEYEVYRLRNDFQHLMDEHSNLHAELRYIQDQLAASSTASQSVNWEYPGGFPGFYYGINGLLDGAYFDELGIEQLAWQNLGTSSAGWQYILFRGSWVNLDNTEANINILSQQGWELVTMFQAGHAAAGGIVVVMRR